MANGPLGGNMGTPPVPPQPPQVSFETTAQSRGNFNNFLKSMPNTTAMTPIPPMGSSPMMPAPNPMSNIDIFNQPPSMGMMGMNQPQMNPMMQPPMQPPTMGGVMGTPVQNFFFGGEAMDFEGFSDSSDPFGGGFSDDAQATDPGGSDNNFDDGFTEEEDESRAGDYQTDDSGVFTGYGDDDSSPEVVDTRPVTNIVNVGAGSNLRYDPQFTANQLQSRGLDPRGFMSDENFAQTTQGVQAQAQAQRDAELAEANRLSGRSLPVMGDLGASRNVAGAIAPAQIASRDVTGVKPTQLDFGLGLELDDPLGLGVRTGFGPVADAARRREALTGAFGSESGDRALDQASLTTVIPGAGGVDDRPTGFVEDDLIGAIIGGRSDLYSPFTNNPGNLKQAREELTTETIKSVDPITGDITTGPALFNTLPAGQQALDRQLSLYGDRSINTPEKFVETYLGTDKRENPLENKQGYITAVRNAVGDNFDLSNPATRTNITNAITRQELGQKGIDSLSNQVTAATGLGEVFNTPITSAGANVRQAQTTLSPPPADFEENVGVPGALRQGDRIVSPDSGLNFQYTTRGTTPKEQDELRELRQIDDDEFNPRVLEASARGSRLGEALANDFLNASRMPGTAVVEGFDRQSTEIDPFDIQPTFQNFGLPGAGNLPTVGSTRSTVAQDQAKAIANLVGDRKPTIAEQLQQNILEERGRALGPTTFRDDTADVTFENIRGQTPTTDTVFDIDTTFDPITLDDRLTTVSPDVLSSIGREQRIDDANTFRKTVPDAAKIFGGRQVSNLPTGAPAGAPEDFEENVGKAFDAKRMAEIERLYGEDVGQTKPGRGSDPTFFEGLGVPGIGTTIGDFIERKSRENMATEVALGRPMTLGETLFGFDADPATTMEEYTKRTGRKIPESQLVRNESGRIIAIKDEFGRVVSGVDPNAPIQSGDDNDDPILIKRPPKKDPEPEDKDKTPNVFGGRQTRTTEPKSVVVDSPFTANVGDYSPVGFDSGDLNKLIESITGIASPRRMEKGGVTKFENGGVISAVDNFLATA